MFDPNINAEQLEQIKNNLQACSDWFHVTFSQPYTVEEMTETLAYYLNAHLYYYSNLPGQVSEKQQRIFKISDRFGAEHFKLTREFKIQLVTAADKKSLLLGEIARYEHPFIFYKMGHYANETVDIVIPHIMDTLAENHSPYFEYLFDDNLDFHRGNSGESVFELFRDAKYLQYLRQELTDFENKDQENTAQDEGNASGSLFHSFAEVFKNRADYSKIVEYLKSIYILNDEGFFVDRPGNKKFIVAAIKVLRKKDRLKPIYDFELSPLIAHHFKISSLSASYLSKNLQGMDELTEEMMRDLHL